MKVQEKKYLLFAETAPELIKLLETAVSASQDTESCAGNDITRLPAAA